MKDISAAQYSKNVMKLTYMANTFILFICLLLTIFFAVFKIKIMFVFGLCAAAFYIISYYLISKRLLAPYIWILYTVLSVYMATATTCLGFQAGFSLYSLSLLPIVFYIEHIAEETHEPSIHPMGIAAMIILCFFIGTLYPEINGPIYTIPPFIINVFFVINAFSVFCFLVVYTKFIMNIVITTEKKLVKIAQEDRLTGLTNRHFMYDYLEQTISDATEDLWLAMLDLDNFKRINDTYGHNAGDQVLIGLSNRLKETCTDCEISRWGGEEFLIVSHKNVNSDLLEKLRKKIEETPFDTGAESIHATVTIGVASYQSQFSVDTWVKEADQYLYYGKNHGKNRVVSASSIDA